VNVRDQDGAQIRVSGQGQIERRRNLADIAEHFAARRDGLNRFEDDWRKMAAKWSAWNLTAIDDRQRALPRHEQLRRCGGRGGCLARALEANGYADWKVHCLVRDRADDDGAGSDVRLTRARPLPRSLIERFGREPEKSILVAPCRSWRAGTTS